MAIDISIFEKLQELKSRYLDGDASAKQQIADWEKRIQELSLKENFMQNPVSQEASLILKAKITNEMKYRLKKGLKEQDRALSDAREESFRFSLGLFNLEYASELETMEQLIDAELI
jgi:hypothetical protein